MHHPTFICQQIAEKLRDPKKVQQIAANPANQLQGPANLWQNYSFADGFGGIAYFYSAMDQVFPGEQWSEVAKQHIVELLARFKEHNQVNASLFNGLAGISLAMSSVLDGSIHFKRFHDGIDDWLIDEVNNSYLTMVPKYLEEKTLIPPLFYSFPAGLSGILNYLLTRKNNPYLQQLAQTSAEALAKMMLSKKIVDNSQVHAWYISQDQFLQDFKLAPIEGGYSSTILYGVTGCLIALSTAVKEGIRSDNIFKAIQLISSWLTETYRHLFESGQWNSMVSVQGTVKELPLQSQELQNSWLGGWPPVAKSLFLAGKALKDETLIQFSKDVCSKFIEKEPTFFLDGSSIYLGIAGFISTLYPIAKEMNHPALLETTRKLSVKCTHLFDTNLAFGFKQHAMSLDGTSLEVECPNLAHGAAGIGLSFLLMEDNCQLPSFT